MKRLLIFITSLLGIALTAPAVLSEPPPPGSSGVEAVPLTFADFLSEAARANLDYAAQRYNVSIAAAQEAAARLLPNPTLNGGYNYDNTHRGPEKMPASSSLGLTQTLELGGKRGARSDVARANRLAAAATLDDFWRTLQAQAAVAFIDALHARQVAAEKTQTHAFTRELLAASEQRQRLGDIGEVDLAQSRVEERLANADRLAAEADASNTTLALCGFLGKDRAQTLFAPEGELAPPAENFTAATLLARAYNGRPDVIAARHKLDALQAGARLARANRIPSVDLGVNVTRNEESTNSIAPSPRYNAAGVSVSVPLPVFNTGRRDVEGARAAAGQAERQLDSTLLKTQIEVRQALAAYDATARTLESYQTDVLRDAGQVLEAKRFAYEHGSVPLIELLTALRAQADIHLAYIDALAAAASARVQVYCAAGLPLPEASVQPSNLASSSAQQP